RPSSELAETNPLPRCGRPVLLASHVHRSGHVALGPVWMSADVSAITRHWHSSLALVAGVATVAMSAPPAQVAGDAGAMAGWAVGKVGSGAAGASRVWADEGWMAFVGTGRGFKGHGLVARRERFVTLPGVPGALLGPFWAMGQHLATAMVEGLG